MRFISYHLIAFLAGTILDRRVGDPPKAPHPVRLIGALIVGLEKKLYPKEPGNKNLRARGAILVLIVLILTGVLTAALTVGAYLIHPVCGMTIETILTCYLLAAKSLRDESMKVYDALSAHDLEGARTAVSMIVGRETANLDEAGVARAAVETVAENASDGVIAPMFYACIGGPILGWLYKAVNTMDSMIGYHNDRYEDFGRFAAKTDDVVNYLPARLAALLMIAVSPAGSRSNAWRIFKRDRKNHKSPNSAQTESACAGALGVQLGGPSVYFGRQVDKPTIGDATRAIQPEDIKNSCSLMYGAQQVFILFIIIVGGMILIARR